MEISKLQKVLQYHRQQELQIQGKMRLTQIKESQTKLVQEKSLLCAV